MAKNLKLSLDGDAFAVLKEDFDLALGRVLGEMEMRKSDEATITLKLDISLTPSSVNCGGEIKDITKPAFAHQITSVIQVKDKVTGKMKGEFAMVWDDDEKGYVLRKIDNGQLNLFDEEDRDAIDVEYTEAPALPIPSDKYDPASDISIPFGYLCQFTGKYMSVTEDNGVYKVRDSDENVILSSGFVDDSPFYCPAGKLKDHEGHSIICVGYGQDGIVNVSIECEDCGVVLFSLDAPDLTEEETPLSEEEQAEAMDAAAEVVDAVNDAEEGPGESMEYDEPEE